MTTTTAMSLFEAIGQAPADPILGLTEAFRADANPGKINLTVGVYQDESGTTPVLACVKEAQRQLLQVETSKSYKPITGDPTYGRLVQELMLGGDHEIVTSGRACTAHTPGGTGALRVAGDYIHHNHPDATLWLSAPTWANHEQVFAHAHVPTKTYPYFDLATNGLDFGVMRDAIKAIPAGDVVLLHGCCHNPTGVDPLPDQWAQIADVLVNNGVLPLVDFAYQGFGKGLTEDKAGLQQLARPGQEMIICSSFSKNFGLYNERTGAATFVARDADAAGRVFSQVKRCIRANYSNPPAHGGAIIAVILEDPQLRSQWQHELTQMRERITGMRQLFVEKLKDHGVKRDFSFIKQQNGMFSFSGLSREHVETLRRDYSIYIVGSGRINVAGITPDNIDALCQAIASVLD